jgi:hypothetical protein
MSRKYVRVGKVYRWFRRVAAQAHERQTWQSHHNSECVIWYAKFSSVTKTQRAFQCQYNCDHVPSHQDTVKWYDMFLGNGLNMPHTGGRVNDRNREEDIRQAMIQCPWKSLHCLSDEKNIPYTTCQRIVRRYLNMFPHHIERLQALTQHNYMARHIFANMCEWEAADDQWLHWCMFMDEATVHVSGRVNTHNAHLVNWESTSPRNCNQQPLSQHVVWSAPWQNVRPVQFCEGNRSCYQLPRHAPECVLSQLTQDGVLDTIIFQHNGAPPHGLS